LSTQEDSNPDSNSTSRTFGMIRGCARGFMFKLRKSNPRAARLMNGVKEVKL
jgi:hypothetical protein